MLADLIVAVVMLLLIFVFVVWAMVETRPTRKKPPLRRTNNAIVKYRSRSEKAGKYFDHY